MIDLSESVARDGFAILAAGVPHAAMQDLERGLAQIHLPRSRAGVCHALRYEPVRSLAHSSELLGIPRKVLGAQAFPFRATLFEKSQSSNWLVVWHQDTALPLRERKDIPGWGPWSVKDGVTYAHAPASALSRVLALRVHLDDSTAVKWPVARPAANSHSGCARR